MTSSTQAELTTRLGQRVSQLEQLLNKTFTPEPLTLTHPNEEVWQMRSPARSSGLDSTPKASLWVQQPTTTTPQTTPPEQASATRSTSVKLRERDYEKTTEEPKTVMGNQFTARVPCRVLLMETSPCTTCNINTPRAKLLRAK